MKKILKVLLVLVLIGISLSLLVIGNGYNMYKEAIDKISIEDKVKEIQSKEDFINIQVLI